jgi:glycosyltransferase involved in cell wall biosynthesis
MTFCDKHNKQIPYISVIMPIRNEAAFIEKAVKSLLSNVYPDDKFELIVVDGESEDGTRQILDKMAMIDPRIRLLSNPDKIVPLAMNIGIKKANGKYIVRVDAHAEYAIDYLKSCVEVLERTGAAVVGGYMETVAASETPVALAIAGATSSRFGVGGSKFRTGGTDEMEVDTVPFGAFQKEVFDKVGLYHPLLVRNQDIEMSSRIRKAGYKIVISPKIKLKYYNRPTFKSLRKQSFANGLWNAYTLKLVGGGLRPRHLIPAAFVAGLIFLLIMALTMGGIFKWLAVAYIGFYLLCGGAEAFRVALREKKLLFCPLVLITFLQMHLWYGLGTLWGFISAPFKFKKSSVINKVENAGR